jgi:hypothetical protein
MIGSFIAYLRLQAMEDGILIQMSVGIATCIDSTIQKKSRSMLFSKNTGPKHCFPKKKKHGVLGVKVKTALCVIFF